jgi:hypothetical protein
MKRVVIDDHDNDKKDGQQNQNDQQNFQHAEPCRTGAGLNTECSGRRMGPKGPDYKKKALDFSTKGFIHSFTKSLVVLALSCSFRLLLASDTRLFIMLSFTDLLLDAGLGAASLETTQCTVQSFILFYDNA